MSWIETVETWSSSTPVVASFFMMVYDWLLGSTGSEQDGDKLEFRSKMIILADQIRKKVDEDPISSWIGVSNGHANSIRAVIHNNSCTHQALLSVDGPHALIFRGIVTIRWHQAKKPRIASKGHVSTHTHRSFGSLPWLLFYVSSKAPSADNFYDWHWLPLTWHLTDQLINWFGAVVVQSRRRAAYD